MKAINLIKYGSPETLQIKEVQIPEPAENELLIKVQATAINDYDWGMIRGKPYLYRLIFGISKPKRQIPGMELSGTVEALGPGARLFKKGDEVYGDISENGFGSFAEYVCVDERAVVKKPAKMSFEEATAIPHASMLAFQGLFDKGNLQNGQNILINGAGGGVGMFALQIAKLHECQVTGVDTAEKQEMMKSLGFDHFIDYRKEDFTKSGQQYDLILDTKTTHSPFAYARALKPGGIYVTVGGNIIRLLQAYILKSLVKWSTKKTISILALRPNKDLNYINGLFEEGKIHCIIDGPYPFEKIPWAVRYFGEGKHKGKVVISL